MRAWVWYLFAYFYAFDLYHPVFVASATPTDSLTDSHHGINSPPTSSFSSPPPLPPYTKTTIEWVVQVDDPGIPSASIDVVHTISHPLITTSKIEMVSHRERAISAVIAAFVADAATMGLHWIYDDNKMKELLENDTKPEFYEPPSCPFYSYENGNLSPYGDEILPLLKYLAISKEFEPKEFVSVSYQAAKEYTGRLNGVMKELVKRGDTEGVNSLYPSTVDNRDAHGINKVPLLYARYGGNTQVFLEKVQEATLVHQNNPMALEGAKAFGLLLDAIIKDQKKIQQAIEELSTNESISTDIRQAIQAVLDRVAQEDATKHDVLAAVNDFGKPCPLPGVLQGALYILLTNSGGLVEGVRSSIKSGGENTSRSMIVASLYAAAASTSQLPEEWKSKTRVYEEIVSNVNQIAEKNTFFQ